MAIRVSPNGREGPECMWLPLSQITIEEEASDGRLKITVPGWLAREKGLSDD